MTFKQAAFIVAAGELEKAKAWAWAVYCNPKLPRRALKKARLDVAAAEMRARRILSAKWLTQLPPNFRREVEAQMERS